MHHRIRYQMCAAGLICASILAGALVAWLLTPAASSGVKHEGTVKSQLYPSKIPRPILRDGTPSLAPSFIHSVVRPSAVSHATVTATPVPHRTRRAPITPSRNPPGTTSPATPAPSSTTPPAPAPTPTTPAPTTTTVSPPPVTAGVTPTA